MIWIKTNELNQVIAFNSNQQPGFIEVEAPADFNDFFDNWAYYYYADGKLIRNNEAINQQQEEKEKQLELTELRERLTATNDKVLEGLEALFTANSITAFITALANQAKSLKETLAERSTIRNRIKELIGG